jgi:hypothetical protein
MKWLLCRAALVRSMKQLNLRRTCYNEIIHEIPAQNERNFLSGHPCVAVSIQRIKKPKCRRTTSTRQIFVSSLRWEEFYLQRCLHDECVWVASRIVQVRSTPLLRNGSSMCRYEKWATTTAIAVKTVKAGRNNNERSMENTRSKTFIP